MSKKKQSEPGLSLPLNVERIALGISLLLGALLRLWGLRKPLWLDEQGHLSAALAPQLSDLFAQVAQHAAAAPLDYLLLRGYVWLSGASTITSLRLLYVFYGLLTIWLMYVLGKRLYSPLVGVLSAYLLASSWYHIHYSQEIRFYALSTLFAVLSAILFEKAKQEQGWKNWLAWGLAGIAGLYTHYFLLLVLSIQLGWLFIGSRFRAGVSLAKPLAVYSFAVAGFLPWYLSTTGSEMDWRLDFSISFAQALGSLLLSFGPALLLFLICSPFGLLRRKHSPLLLMLAGLPFLGVYLLDSMAGYFFNLRQVIFSLPFLLLLCAAGLESLGLYVLGHTPPKQRARVHSKLAWALFALLFAFTFASVGMKLS